MLDQQSSEKATRTYHKRDHVFISYSHTDAKWLDRLLLFLKPYIRQEQIETWDDTKIRPGAEWKKEIERALASARVAVLMVSHHFLASDYIANEELPPLLDAAKKEGLTILWIAVGESAWDITPIADYQAANDPTRPLKGLRPAAQDRELRHICETITKAAKAWFPTDSPLVEAPFSNESKQEEGVINVLAEESKGDQQATMINSGSGVRAFQENQLLAGYIFVEEDGRELILVRSDARLPIVKIFTPYERTIEQAINEAVIDLFTDLGITIEEVVDAGFSRPFYCQLYKVNHYLETFEARPCIFFKLGLNKAIQGTTLSWEEEEYRWAHKKQIAEWWKREDFVFGQDDKYEVLIPYLDDPYEAISEDRVSVELGLKVLECVDMLIFRKNEEGKIQFLVIKRRRRGWEYPKGGLYYHETLLEGALREIAEEVGIHAGMLHYCGYLGWQIADVRARNKFYNTLRVHGLTFYYSGDPTMIKFTMDAPHHIDYDWRTFDEAKNDLWIPYGKEFFNRWGDRQQEIMQKAGITSYQV